MQKTNLFISHKSSRAIPFANAVTHDFLIQAALDGDVRRIEYQSSVAIDERIVPVDGIIVDRFDGRFAIDIVDARPAHDPTAEALTQLAFARKTHGIIEVSAADVREQPRCSAARDVWSHRSVRLHADDRAEILATLERDGPVSLAELIGSVATRGEACALIFALATEGAVALDLRGGITDDLIVRAGHAGSSVGLHAYGA